MSHTLLTAALLLALAASAQQAVNPQPPPPVFEVVSIKLSPEAAPRTGMMFPSPGSLTVGNYSLKRLLSEVYRVRVDGGPTWMDSDTAHFDIFAKAGFPAKFTQMVEMLKPVIDDRFHLRSHRETRDLPGFTLKVAKGGPKMTRYTKDDKVGAYSLRNNVITTSNMNMKMLAGNLTYYAGGPVIDETGLDGAWGFVLRLPPPDVKASSPDGAAVTPDGSPSSIFSALEDQLGLRLEKRKVPTEFLVIDSAQRPTAN
jgi:uncharacterized protein (TIGR03435 family)